jgi:hypothetical protein
MMVQTRALLLLLLTCSSSARSTPRQFVMNKRLLT